MNKKVLKLALISSLIAILILSISSIAFATGSWEDIDTNFYSGKGDSTSTSQTVGNIIGSILNVVQVIGVGVAIIMLIVLAIKYISAAPSDKAEIKKHAVVYVVGAVVLFAAAGILQLVKQFAGIINSTVSGG